MKKFTTLLCLFLLVAAFVFMFVFTVCLPRTTISDYSILMEWPEFSFETLFSGEYFKDVMYCFTDTVHGRDRFIDYESKISSLYGIPEDEQVVVIDPDAVDPDADNSIESSADDSTTSSNANSDVFSDTPPESTYNPEENQSTVISSDVSEPSNSESDGDGEKLPVELSGSIYIIGNRALEIYYGSEARAVQYAEIMSSYADKVAPNVNVYSMVVPKSSAYYLGQASDEYYANLALRNKNNIETISANLSPNVIDVNIYNTLGLHASEEIYCRTDHHWTALGAYYAAEVFADKAGVAFDDLSQFEEVRREGYLGTYFTWSGNNTVLLNNPEDFLAYYPDADYEVTYYSPTDLTSNPREHDGGFFWEISDKQRSSWYSTFLRGDSYSVKAVSNECKNGRKLLIVKDSYGNALAPFMLEGFEEIYIVDAREYQVTLDETIEKYGITDVLFAECTFSAVSNDYLNKLKELCK